MRAPRLWLAAMLVCRIGAPSETSVHGGAARPMPATAMHLSIDVPLPSLNGATTWLESRPLTTASLRGKVVVIDFSTYTCINSLRALPYVRAWAEKYRARGVVVINVQAPEFEFEKNPDNVRRAVREQRIDFPTAVDNDHAIWRAFDNAYWPALYIADAEGQIRYHHFGEGAYEASERVVQQLLAEGGHGDVEQGLVSVHHRGVEAAADWKDLLSQETYVGYDRAENFASPGGAARDQPHVYAAPDSLALNQWALSGAWTVGHQGAVSHAPNARITEQRLYQLIRQPQPITDRTFDIEFLDAGGLAVVFTFG